MPAPRRPRVPSSSQPLARDVRSRSLRDDLVGAWARVGEVPASAGWDEQALALSRFLDEMVRVCRADPRLLSTWLATYWVDTAKAWGALAFLRRLPGKQAKGLRPRLSVQDTMLLYVVERLRWPR